MSDFGKRLEAELTLRWVNFDHADVPEEWRVQCDAALSPRPPASGSERGLGEGK